ncbi:MAG: hypothetical protein JO263_07950, partial [Candidatus Eremiobacteraeota bacterium]|nr:hypothetical protein [Candidatus Eremiobacteraeota bacterium]
MPRWAISTGVLIGVYLVVIIAAALWIPHEWDWHALQWLGSRVTPAFSPEVTIVDVDWSPDIASDRRRIADFLDGLVRSNRRPNAVILDVEFGPCQSNPCGAPMTSARTTLIASIRAAARRFPVYATEEPGIDRNDDLIGPLEPQDSLIYGVLTGAAQTKFTAIPNSGGLFYRICYANVPFVNELGEVQGKENVWAMTVRALMAPRAFANAPVCDSAHVPVRLGPAISAVRPLVYRFTNARTFSGYSQFDERTFVIVGTIRYDRLPFTERSGPEMLGWALSNALDQG